MDRARTSQSGATLSIPTNGAAPTSVARSGQAIAVSPSTGAIYVSNADDYKVSRVDPITLLTQATSINTFNGTAIAVAPGGDEVYVDNPSGVLSMLDPTTLAVRGQVTLPSYGVSGITVSPHGAQIYVALFDSKLAIVDRATRTVISTLTGWAVTRSASRSIRPGTTAFVVNLEGVGGRDPMIRRPSRAATPKRVSLAATLLLTLSVPAKSQIAAAALVAVGTPLRLTPVNGPQQLGRFDSQTAAELQLRVPCTSGCDRLVRTAWSDLRQVEAKVRGPSRQCASPSVGSSGVWARISCCALRRA